MIDFDFFQPGARAKVFDLRLYKDDVKTPLSVTMQPATILKREIREIYGRKIDVVDVRFDYDGRESCNHFVWALNNID